MGPEALRITSRIVVILWAVDGTERARCATVGVPLPNPAEEALRYKGSRCGQAIPHPIHLLVPSPPSLCALRSTTGMSTNLYEILGLQRDATADQSMSNPRPRSCPPLNALICL